MALCEVTAEFRMEVGCGSEPGPRQAVLLGQGTHRPGVQWALLQPWAKVPCPRLRRWLRAPPRGTTGRVAAAWGTGRGRTCVHLPTRTPQTLAPRLHGVSPDLLL